MDKNHLSKNHQHVTGLSFRQSRNLSSFVLRLSDGFEEIIFCELCWLSFYYFRIYHKLVKLIKSKLHPSHLSFLNEKCDTHSINACDEGKIATKLQNS